MHINPLHLKMSIDTVIFDMDGLLIDSEPLWNDAAFEVFSLMGKVIDKKRFSLTTGLRTHEFVQWWFAQLGLDPSLISKTELEIVQLVEKNIISKAEALPGVSYILNFFMERGFKVGLASSSPMSLINIVIDHFGLKSCFHSISSAAELKYGKPHPQVYLNCADQLHSEPISCIAFEDSFNGMLAAKSARMKCIVVPHSLEFMDKKWAASDLKISSLSNFNDLLLHSI